MSWENLIRLIQDGEPVSSGTPNRPLQQLDQNIRYLRSIIEAANIGSTVYARSQTVVSTLQVGQPVFYNATNSRFEPAFATAASDSATGYLTVPDQAQVWGIVASKQNATLADILLFGHAKIDISAAIGDAVNDDGSVPAGTWYLSNVGAGLLTKQQPPVTIPVCKTDNSGFVYVNPKFIDFLENHRHYVFPLVMEPAGDVTPPAIGGTHTITNPDPDILGWLPANHAVFAGNAPAGAKFGYNLAKDTSLNGVFPPVPLQSVSVTMQRPSVWDTDTTRRWYGQELMSDLVVVDRNGIWWMSDCYDEVPWPTDKETGVSESTHSACSPLGREFLMKLYFTRVGFATENAVVSSLTSLDARLKIQCSGLTTTGRSGDLDLDLDLSLMNGATDVAGYTVIKSFDPDTGKFDSGPVASGVFATSANVLLTGDDTRVNEAGETVFLGDVGIGVLNSNTQELSAQLVHLDGVTEENYPVLYLGMPNDVTTSYVVKFEIPADAPSVAQIQLRARILGRSAGTLPQLGCTYFKTSRPPNGLLTPVNVTQSYSAFTMNTVATISANQAVEATSAAISVSPGDIVYMKIVRTPADVSDTYAGELGVMQQVGVLTAA